MRSRVPPIRSLIDRSASLAALCWPLALQGEGTVRESPEWVNCRLFGLQVLRVDGADQQDGQQPDQHRPDRSGAAVELAARPARRPRQQVTRAEGADLQDRQLP